MPAQSHACPGWLYTPRHHILNNQWILFVCAAAGSHSTVTPRYTSAHEVVHPADGLSRRRRSPPEAQIHVVRARDQLGPGFYIGLAKGRRAGCLGR